MIEIERTVQQIQYVLGPAVMVSSGGLFLLGFQNKYSNLTNRFRALNQERRQLSKKLDISTAERERLISVDGQLETLFVRIRYVKSAILLVYAAVLCFVGTSVLIFVNVYAASTLSRIVLVPFALGLLCLVPACILMLLETRLSYRIMVLEKSS